MKPFDVAATLWLLFSATRVESSWNEPTAAQWNGALLPDWNAAGRPWGDRVPIAAPRRGHRKLDFGDYAEEPEQCPATTTCPVVCVANATECPSSCDPGQGLCADGRCHVDCVDDIATVATTLHTDQCPCDAMPVSCPRVIDLYDACQRRFALHYQQTADCVDGQVQAVPKVSFLGAPFVICYVFYGGLAVLVMLWCYYNQIVAPVPLSTVPLVSSSAAHTDTEPWTQTGYKINVWGTILDTLVEFSFILIQILLLWTTLMFYTQQEGITRWKPFFYDEIQVLTAFIIVWMVGFVWCFAFRYPSTGVQSLFLRRCTLDEASYVAVVAPVKAVGLAPSTPLSRAARWVWTPVDTVLRTLFSYPYDQPGWETVFCPVQVDPASQTRSILHRFRRYVYELSNDESTSGTYIPCAMSVGTTFGDLVAQMGGLSWSEAVVRLGRQGPNTIPLPKPSIVGSLYKEFDKSFYLYQNFCIWVYANLWYYHMACIFTFCRVAGAFLVVYFQHQSESLLYNLSHTEGTVEVLRDGTFTEILVEEVVPGDVVVLKPGVVCCDMVVLQGFRVLVDESALTGEATPQLKAEFDRALRHVPYVPSQHKMCTLSAGTEILELNDDGGKTLGLVMTTGSFTTKGELLTDVLSYQRQNVQYADEIKVILFILLVEAVILISLVFVVLPDHWVYNWFYGLYIMASILPILLPTVCIVSICVSANRLQSKRISCPYPESLLLAGKVDAAFFDKTGTLTQLGMEFISFDASLSGDRIRIGMAVCHTLTSTRDGKIVGNQVDMAAFETTGATLRHDKGSQAQISFNGEEYTVLKRFEFDSHRATQSVVIEDSKLKRQIYVKGSPEVIKSLCMETSVPDTFDRTVQESAAAGIYQIAIAYRSYNLEMELADVRREDVEGCLTFGGFLNFRNPIREETLHVLETIDESEMASAMITGDNVFTGIFIARESNIIKPNRTVVVGTLSAGEQVIWYNVDADAVGDKPSPYMLSLPENEVDLAITGEAWNHLLTAETNYAVALMKHIRVFGRCKPADKVSVVAAFVSHGYMTLMCGDGQNDCGCLKTAHVGVALSSAEASIVAPFTSLDKSLTSVLDVLREGRCTLASTISAYSYYFIFGQTETFLQVTMAYLAISLSEWCWVFLDGIFSISMVFSIPLAQAADQLTNRRPTDQILGLETVCSVCGILACNLFYIILALVVLFQQDWFQCRKWDSQDVSDVLGIGDNYESTVLFLMGGSQFIASAFVMNFGYTFRQAWYRNFVLVFLSSTWMVLLVVMTLVPSSFSCVWRVNCDNENVVRYLTSPDLTPIQNPFNTTVMPLSFRLFLILIMAANLITLIVWQVYFVHGYLVRPSVRSPLESYAASMNRSEQPMDPKALDDEDHA